MTETNKSVERRLARQQTITVEVGQVWADNDSRVLYRKVRVVEVDGIYALVENCDTQKRTSIRLDRFKPTSTGYWLVRDATKA